MKKISLSIPEFLFIVATRAVLGVGIGLLVAGRIRRPRRRSVGATLAAIGALTTVPAAITIFRRRAEESRRTIEAA